MGYSINSGQSGQYPYFFCLGRAKKRRISENAAREGATGTPGTICDMPYLAAESVENAVVELWYRETLSPDEAAGIKAEADRQLAERRSTHSRDLKTAERDVKRLTVTKQRLLDAYLAEASTLEDFQAKQTQLMAQLATAQARLSRLTKDLDKLSIRLELVLSLLTSAGRYYEQCPSEARRLLNHAVYERIRVGVEDDEFTDDETEVVAAVTGLVAPAPQIVSETPTTMRQQAADDPKVVRPTHTTPQAPLTARTTRPCPTTREVPTTPHRPPGQVLAEHHIDPDRDYQRPTPRDR